MDFCAQFQHNGKCDYGKEYRFAHEESERRPRVLPILYKTVMYATNFLRTTPAPTVRNVIFHTCRSKKLVCDWWIRWPIKIFPVKGWLLIRVIIK